MSTELPLPVVIDVSAIHPTSGGAGTYVRRLVEQLPAAGIAPTLIARHNDTEPWIGASRVARIVPGPRPVRLLWEQVGLTVELRRQAPNATVLHSPHYTMPLALRRVPRVVTVHDLTFFTDPDAHDRSKVLLFRSALQLASRYADALITVSEATARHVREHTSPRVPIHVIPHGVDHAHFSPVAGPADDEILRALGVEEPYVLHLGAIEPRKNVPALIRAHRLLVERGDDRDTMLVLAGRAWRGRGLESEPRTGRHGDRVRRLGFVADDAAPVLLRHAAVVAYPSRAEGFGLPVIEALACGAPVLTSRNSVMAELAEGAAVLVDPSSDDAIATGLAAALRGEVPNRPDRLACAARFRWDLSAAAHARLYRDLAESSSSSRR